MFGPSARAPTAKAVAAAITVMAKRVCVLMIVIS
jgi:hypothetical protein